MLTTLNPPEQRVILPNISWSLYETILSELKENSSPRLTYYQGNLEIMTPLWEHEESKRKIERFIDILVEELNLEVRMGGSVTLKRQDMQVGKEPDSCYYIQNVELVKNQTQIDLQHFPPPDLAIEIDLTSSSLNKLDIYVNLEVPELWRYDGKKVQFYQLYDRQYVECNYSPTFPLIATQKVEEFLRECEILGVKKAIKNLRQWCQINYA